MRKKIMYVYLPACIDTEAERCLQTPSSIWVISVVLYFPSYSVKLFQDHILLLNNLCMSRERQSFRIVTQ